MGQDSAEKIQEICGTNAIKYSTINGIFEQKEKYLIIGLTGKVGAGCSTTAGLLQKTLEGMNLSYAQPGIEGFDDDRQREYRALQRFYSWHQKTFYLIKVRDVILSFILENKNAWKDFLRRAPKYEDELKKAKEDLEKQLKQDGGCPSDIIEYTRKIFRMSKEKVNAEQRHRYVKHYIPMFGEKVHSILKEQYTELFQYYGNQLRFFGTTLNNKTELEEIISKKEKFTIQRSKATGYSYLPAGDTSNEELENEIEVDTVFTIAERINIFIKALEYPKDLNHKTPIAVIIDSIKNIYESNYLKDRYTAYYLISVNRDEQLRRKGIQKKKVSYSQEQLDFIDWNERPKDAQKKLRVFARIFERVLKENINATQKSFALKYIESIANGNEEELLHILLEPEKWNENQKSIKKISKKGRKNGFSNYDREIVSEFKDSGISSTLHNYYCSILEDPLRIYLYVSKLYPFYVQDVEMCIQNADIFLANNELSDEKKYLCQSIVRYLSLMMHPGLVPPTPVERCMQIAYTAKVNSGCISRQVGAVVTDSEYRILSLGWNDVPYGQTPCVLRNIIDVSRGLDQNAYSEYEIGKGSAFKHYLERYRFEQKNVEIRLKGLPACYCFKDINEELTGQKNPMEARSMHGEEKALLLCDQERVKGGYLFTTSSPCMMCSKNAKEHQIKKIYYIEPYPGISQSHVCNSGAEDNRAQYVLFEGAIGRAYTQLYTPVMSYKDELEVRGVPEGFLVKLKRDKKEKKKKLKSKKQKK